MALQIDPALTPAKLRRDLERLFEISGQKILALERTWKPSQGTPVFTVRGRYTSRGWTEWTQGFQFGAALLQFDATGEQKFLELGRQHTMERMAAHVSHTGVHDHGFNNISTYGNLRRLMREGKAPLEPCGLDFCELALKVSGAIQAARWSPIAGGGGYIYSFNGPHSLFVDTIRSLRVLGLSHMLGHRLMTEQDKPVSLLQRLVEHGRATATYNVFYGTGRDLYDVRGRTAHESLFNPVNGEYRCPSTQQGYSPFSTWTRGLAWVLCGFAEQLEFLQALPASEQRLAVPDPTRQQFEQAALATADFYLAQSCRDGVPMWDTGAPGLAHMGEYRERAADPFNPWEPVDSSAAAIAAQGLWRLGRYDLQKNQRSKLGLRFQHAALTIAKTLLHEPYLSLSPKHQGLLLHSLYHRPNGWDHIGPGQKIPNGESSMWGDYHLRELALLLLRAARKEPHFTFFS